MRVMGPPYPGKWTFKHHPWLREMHDCNAVLMVGQKAAQMGFTETALNKTFYNIDMLGKDVLYVLPNKSPDASDFSNARFGPALELSPHLQNLFSDTDNIGHKRAGTANLYVRGSKSKAGLRSVPVSFIILDEVDVMAQENIPLAFERTSGQPTRQVFMLSTPTLEGCGINEYYVNSTQEHFMFPCPSCSKSIQLTMDNLKVCGDDPNSSEINKSHLICNECKAVLNHQDKPRFLGKGIWVPTGLSEVRGFHVNQLYSCALSPVEVAKSYLRGLSNPFDETEFFNSKMGMPHTVEGARVTDAHISARTGVYHQVLPHEIPSKRRFVTMGVDVGKFLHVVISEWYFDSTTTSNTQAMPKVISIQKLLDFEDLDRLMAEYQVLMCVVDMNPERRKVREFCTRHSGRAYGCEYVQGIKAREIATNEEDATLHVDRTSWLDLSQARFQREGGIKLPMDMPFEYKEQIKVLARIYYRDRDNNPVAKWACGNKMDGKKDDHYAHAQVYAEIAFAKAMPATFSNHNIASPW